MRSPPNPKPMDGERPHVQLAFARELIHSAGQGRKKAGRKMSSYFDWERTRRRALRAARAMAVGAALTSAGCGDFERNPDSVAGGGDTGSDAAIAGDASIQDARPPVNDAAVADAGPRDSDPPDISGPVDGGPPDTGPADVEIRDEGPQDRAPPDIVANPCSGAPDNVCSPQCTFENDADCCVAHKFPDDGCGNPSRGQWRNGRCIPEVTCAVGPFSPPSMV